MLPRLAADSIVCNCVCYQLFQYALNGRNGGRACPRGRWNIPVNAACVSVYQGDYRDYQQLSRLRPERNVGARGNHHRPVRMHVIMYIIRELLQRARNHAHELLHQRSCNSAKC